MLYNIVKYIQQRILPSALYRCPTCKKAWNYFYRYCFVYLEYLLWKDITIIYQLEKSISIRKNAFSRILLKVLMNGNNFLLLESEKGVFLEKLIGLLIIIEDKRFNRARIKNVLIDPKYQGRGYGKNLFKNSLEILKKKSPEIKKIIISTNINNSVAVRLYEKFNFYITKNIGNNGCIMELKISY